jgi:SPOR domain
MSNTYRDPNPPERPLAFDRYADRPRRGPAPVTLIVSLMILAGVGGGVVYLYRGGVRGPDGPPEPVGVPIRDVRVAAPPQAPAPDPAAGLSIYKDDPNATPGAPSFAPPPEQPMPRPSPPAAAAPMASPAVTTTIAATNAPLVATMAPAPGAGSLATGPASVKPAKSAKAASTAKAPTIDTLLAETPPPVAVKHVETASTTTPKRVETASTATPKRVETAPAATAKHPETASTVAKRASPAGGYVVQIGAFSSPALADKEWSSAAGLASGTMAGKGKRVAQITKDGATLYRTAITGFDTREQAQAVCAKLAAAGRACFVR